MVLLSTKNIRTKLSKKLKDRFIGPYRVVECVGSVAYRLDLSSSPLRNLHPVFHVSLLIPYVDNGLH